MIRRLHDESCARPAPAPSPALEAAATDLAAFHALAERCRYDAAHARQVAGLAMTLFDELTALHDLAEVDRHDLHLAALLHDIGHIGGKRGHHKRSMHLILDEAALPLDDRRRLIVACLARYHRKALPKLSHDAYARLALEDRRRVRFLAGLLRVADALDNGHLNIVTDLRTAATERTLLLDCQVQQREAAQRLILPINKADLLQHVLHRQIEIVFRET